MVYENRLPINYSFGALSTALAVSDITLNSADFATGLPAGLSTSTYVPITLQDNTTKQFEIVWATAHAAAATSATVVRARESSTARAWASGTQWLVGPTIRDAVLPVANRSALPSDAHIGMRALIQDEQVAVTYLANAGWVNDRGTEVHAAYKANVAQTFPSSAVRKVYYGTSVATSALVTATLGTASTGSSFTLNRAGVWLIEGGTVIGWSGGVSYRAIGVIDEPYTVQYRSTSTVNNGAGSNLHISLVRRFSAGARVAIGFYHELGSSLDLLAGDTTGVSLTWLGP